MALSPPIRHIIKWAVILIGSCGSIILFIFEVHNQFEKSQTDSANKDTIFQELWTARNSLFYTYIQRQLNIRNHPVINLSSKEYISQTFADDLDLKNKILNVHQSLSAAQSRANEWMELLSSPYSDPQTIKNRENDILRSIELADDIGPKLAKELGESWNIPHSNLPLIEQKKWCEAMGALSSGATDYEIDGRWHIKQKKK